MRFFKDLKRIAKQIDNQSTKNTYKKNEPYKKAQNNETNNYTYIKKKLLTANEIKYAEIIRRCIPKEYILLPQICLASIINKIGNSKYINELFKIADFGIFDKNYNIIALIEVNDGTHNESNRIERDIKVNNICQKAGIPIINIWSEYSMNEQYIKNRFNDCLKSQF